MGCPNEHIAIACGEECASVCVGGFTSYGIEFGIVVEFEFDSSTFDRVVVLVENANFGT